MAGHEGHRSRILAKLDSDTLLEHELLEVLLFNAQPRKNTNDLAHALLAHFGGIREIFNATAEQLQAVRGVGPSIASYLVCIGKFYHKYYNKTKKSFEGAFEIHKFLSYVKTVYHNEKREVMDLYLLDQESTIFEKHRFTFDSLCTVKLQPELLTDLLLAKRPSGVVMVHNHPLGNAIPSETDDYTTSKCQLVCSFHNVLFCDHVIYAPNGLYSYYLSGRMQEISNHFSMESILGNRTEARE